MLATRTIPDTNIIEVEFSGALRVEDEQVLRTTLQHAVDTHDKIRLLGVIGSIEYGRIEPAAVWMDLKNAAFIPRIERAALVMEPGPLEKITSVLGAVIPGMEWRSFAPGERDAAEAWLRA